MYKTTKFIYNLGVRHERTRIKALLDNAAYQAGNSSRLFGNQLRENSNRLNSETLKRQLELQQAILSIINDIMSPQISYDPQQVSLAPIDETLEGMQ